MRMAAVLLYSLKVEKFYSCNYITLHNKHAMNNSVLIGSYVIEQTAKFIAIGVNASLLERLNLMLLYTSWRVSVSFHKP